MPIKGNFLFPTQAAFTGGFLPAQLREVCVRGSFLRSYLFIYCTAGAEARGHPFLLGAWSYRQTRARPSSLQTPAPTCCLLPWLRRSTSPHASVYPACSKSQTFLPALPGLQSSSSGFPRHIPTCLLSPFLLPSCVPDPQSPLSPSFPGIPSLLCLDPASLLHPFPLQTTSQFVPVPPDWRPNH